MLDVAIVGGGLSGLALARKLHRRGRDLAIFEARDRIGGRILTVAGRNGGGLDLGAGWFWPETQPLVAGLVKELGLADYTQHDNGVVLHLREADKKAEQIEGQRLYNGARRLHGGMETLVDAVAADLPKDVICLQHALAGLRDCGDHVVLTLMAGGRVLEISARRVVLTLPPRLLRETVDFAPRLDPATDNALLGAETWMAAQAKAAIEFSAAFWREEGLSGSAYVTHEQAVLGEIFDACDPSANMRALGGFLAFDAELRKTFDVGLPILISSQVASVFGRDVEPLALHYQDWANEPWTCSAADRAGQPGDSTGDVGNPMLRQSFWDKKLYLGGTETAARNSGYLEGALDAARRVDRALTAIETKKILSSPLGNDPFRGLPLTEASLARFSAWVDAQSDVVFDDYKRRLTRGLASQQRESLTQIAVLGAMEEVFQQSLKLLETLPFDMQPVTVERGRTSLTPRVQKPFADLIQAIIDDVTAFNQTSCALSNFPSEHRLSKDYVQVIMQDIAAAWREFSLSANGLLLQKKNEQHTQEKMG
jgi:monoamine oxidase